MATCEWNVSIEIMASGKCFFIEIKEGPIRFHSSVELIDFAPGRVDCPPISNIVAPSFNIDSAKLKAEPTPVICPPS